MTAAHSDEVSRDLLWDGFTGTVTRYTFQSDQANHVAVRVVILGLMRLNGVEDP